jgi:hypothetical protein
MLGMPVEVKEVLDRRLQVNRRCSDHAQYHPLHVYLLVPNCQATHYLQHLDFPAAINYGLGASILGIDHMVLTHGKLLRDDSESIHNLHRQD